MRCAGPTRVGKSGEIISWGCGVAERRLRAHSYADAFGLVTRVLQMTPLRLTAAVATLLPLLISPLAASDEDGNYTSVGLGGQSCKRFVSTLSDRARSASDGKLFRT